MIGLIVVVVVLVASIVLAIFASKVWHWSHVLVIVGLVFATIGYSNLGYRIASKRLEFQQREKQDLDQLQQVQTRIDMFDRGGPDRKSLGDLEQELRLENRVRGRLWNNVRPLGAPSEDTFEVEVGVSEDASPMNVSQGAILYAFEQGDPAAGANYIGEFRVIQADPRRLMLEPVQMMNEADLDRYFDSADAGRTWVLHETMPVDTYEMFAELTDDQLRELLPEDAVEEYLRHGGEPQPDDDPRRIMGYDEDGILVGPEEIDRAERRVYFRQLRDYAYEFQEQATRQQQLRGESAALESNLQRTQEALAGAQELAQMRLDEQRKLQHDLDGAKRDQQAAQAYLASVRQQLQRIENLLTQTLAANARTAEDLARTHASLAGSPDLNTQPTRSRGAIDQHAL